MPVTPIASSSPQRAPSWRRASACAPALLALALPVAQAQLTDGGFDINPLTTIAAVINTPNPMLFGQWGQESATLVGPVGPVVPLTLPFMLSSTAALMRTSFCASVVLVRLVTAFTTVLRVAGDNWLPVSHKFNLSKSAPGSVALVDNAIAHVVRLGYDTCSRSSPLTAARITR